MVLSASVRTDRRGRQLRLPPPTAPAGQTSTQSMRRKSFAHAIRDPPSFTTLSRGSCAGGGICTALSPSPPPRRGAPRPAPRNGVVVGSRHHSLAGDRVRWPGGCTRHEPGSGPRRRRLPECRTAGRGSQARTRRSRRRSCQPKNASPARSHAFRLPKTTVVPSVATTNWAPWIFSVATHPTDASIVSDAASARSTRARSAPGPFTVEKAISGYGQCSMCGSTSHDVRRTWRFVQPLARRGRARLAAVTGRSQGSMRQPSRRARRGGSAGMTSGSLDCSVRRAQGLRVQPSRDWQFGMWTSTRPSGLAEKVVEVIASPDCYLCAEPAHLSRSLSWRFPLARKRARLSRIFPGLRTPRLKRARASRCCGISSPGKPRPACSRPRRLLALPSRSRVVLSSTRR